MIETDENLNIHSWIDGHFGGSLSIFIFLVAIFCDCVRCSYSIFHTHREGWWPGFVWSTYLAMSEAACFAKLTAGFSSDCFVDQLVLGVLPPCVCILTFIWSCPEKRTATSSGSGLHFLWWMGPCWASFHGLLGSSISSRKISSTFHLVLEELPVPLLAVLWRSLTTGCVCGAFCCSVTLPSTLLFKEQVFLILVKLN